MYYGQFGLDKFLFERYFQNKRDGFFVECGALDGNLESTCKFFEESLGWRGMNIEPVPPMFQKLKENRPNSINVNVALSNNDVKSIFKHAVHPQLGLRFGNGSLNHNQKHMEDLIRQKCTFVEYEVQCLKFSSLWADSKEEIDLFVLDVEGHEISALEGIVKIKESSLPKVFCIEYPHAGLENISNILGSKYKFDVIKNNNAIYLKNEL